MNLKKVMTGALGLGLVLSLGMNSMTAYAKEGNEGNVVNTQPTSGSNANVEFTGGMLTFGNVEGINFGSSKIGEEKIGEGGNYHFASSGLSFEVKDMRGTGAGWQVTAKIDDFKDENENSSLKGAEITLNNGTATPGTAFEGVRSPKFKTKDGLLLKKEERRVVIAKRGDTFSTSKGTGVWMMAWLREDDVELSIPAKSASVGEHSATITWTLKSDMTTNTDNQGSDEN